MLEKSSKNRYLIYGKGRSGLAAAKLLESKGFEVVLFDDNSPGSPTARAKSGMMARDYAGLVLSPGIPRTKPLVQEAIKQNITIYNEIDIAYKYLPNTKFIGITGTNGKSTVTAVVFEILKLLDNQKTQNNNNFIGGNFGMPLCEAVTQGLKPKYAVLELSSYQLETLTDIKFEAGCILNLAPDHLDRYDNFEAYCNAKRKLKKLVTPIDTSSMDPRLKANPALCDLFASRMTACYFEDLAPTQIDNKKAAQTLCEALNIDSKIITQGLANFKGLPHRLEVLGSRNGITYINDSKATNEAAVISALESLSDKNIHIILGGQGKNTNWDFVKKFDLKNIYAIGQEAQSILKFYPNAINSKTLEQAVLDAQNNAKPGDIILLSPACASFDQFQNFEERGNRFRKLFNSL